MAALTDKRVIPSTRGEIIRTIDFPCASAQVFYNNGFVALNTSGYLVPAATTAGLRVAGLVDLTLHASFTAASSNGGSRLPVKQGIFPFNIGASTDALTQADALKDVYVLDDQTVGRLPTGGRPIAGQLIEVEGTIAWVAVGFRLPGTSNERGGGTAYQGDGSTENIAAAGAVSVNTHISLATVTGTTAYTLANGLFVGQQKIVTCIAGSGTPNATVTPTTPSGFASVSAIGAVGDSVMFVWTGSAWILGPSFGCTPA